MIVERQGFAKTKWRGYGAFFFEFWE
jgi:hypothetical protein